MSREGLPRRTDRARGVLSQGAGKGEFGCAAPIADAPGSDQPAGSRRKVRLAPIRWPERSGARRFPAGGAWPATGELASPPAAGDARFGRDVRLGHWSTSLSVPATVLALAALGLALRLVAALRLGPHVDEASSLLAATMVAERGLPILPSGTVYFQGATLSYLLAPFVALGADTLVALEPLRVLCALAGALSVPLTYGLARAVSGEARTAAFAAALVALDPVAVQWSAHLRMYALLQPLTIGFAWLVVSLATDGVSWRRLAALVGVTWALTFTHVAALALCPGAALALWWAHRRSARSIRLRLAGAGVVGGLAPVTLLALNRALGSASVDGGQTLTGWRPSFVGDHLIALRRLPALREVALTPETLWAGVPDAMTWAWLLPLLVLLAAGLVASWRVLRPGPARVGWDAATRKRVAVLLALGWLPAAVVWLGSDEPRARYVVHVHALGWAILAALAAGALARGLAYWRGTARRLAWRDAAALLIGPVVLVAGLGWRLADPIVHPDHVAALAYVAERREPGEPLLVALPAVAYLTPGAEDGVVFLAGSDDRPRSKHLTRRSASGELTDYWVGVPAITSADDLRGFMAAHPDAWIVVDEERLNDPWAYAGPIAEVLRQGTWQLYEGPGQVLVLRPLPATAVPPTGARGT